MTTLEHPDVDHVWYSLSVDEATEQLHVDLSRGLDDDEVVRRREQYGPNALATEPPPSLRTVARGQLTNPMNVMLLVVGITCFTIAEVATGLVVLGLVVFNVVMGSNQELKAQASVDALAKLQVPQARVRRAGVVEQVDSTQLVPGDVVLVEAGDVVPADGRLVMSSSLEVQEAALTGESQPTAKSSRVLPAGDVALGDRSDLVFQNTQVTRGAAEFVVTAIGEATEMGRIADMVRSTKRSRSPLQVELDGMTKVFGAVAWLAVGVIAIVGAIRGEALDTLALLCVSTAISA